jgi:acyl carrier protein
MTHDEIRDKLAGVFRRVFDEPALTIGDLTTAKDVEGWDSLAHVSLIVAVEKAFGVRFTTKEVKALANVGDFIRLIERHAK